MARRAPTKTGRRIAPMPWRALFGVAALGTAAWMLRESRGAATSPLPGGAPVDRPEPFADGIHIVDSVLPGVIGRVFPVRMTAIRLPDGSLLLHSPTRHSAALQAALEAEGPIRHLVAPNVAHWIFLADWQAALPDAITWAAPNLDRRRQVRRSGVRIDRILFDGAPLDWDGAIELVTVPGAIGFREVALFHRASRTLVLTDLMMDLRPDRVPAALRPLVVAAGMTAPDRMPPPHLRAVVRGGGGAARDAARRLLELAPDRVLFAHGTPVDTDGAAALGRSLRWLLGSA